MALRHCRPGDLVKVDWVDSTRIIAADGFGWRPLDDLAEDPDLACLSVGLVIRHSPKMLTIVFSCDGKEYLGALSIPLVAITKIVKIGALT